MTAASDIVGMDAVQLGAAIHARRISCVEVMDAYLAQIEQLNPTHNAIVALQDREGLLGQAQERDATATTAVPLQARLARGQLRRSWSANARRRALVFGTCAQAPSGFCRT